MSPSAPSPVPPWLRRSGGSRRGRWSRIGGRAVLAVVLFGAGVATGIYVRRPPPPAAPVAAAAPVCPPAAACPDGDATRSAHRRVPAAPTRRAKTPAAALRPLPERAPLDEGERRQALRAFAEQKATELRECLDEPDRGPPRNLGAAFEIDPKGTVDSVQILGADSSPKAVRRCYADRLKQWRFPEELLRGDEKLLVNFVL